MVIMKDIVRFVGVLMLMVSYVINKFCFVSEDIVEWVNKVV